MNLQEYQNTKLKCLEKNYRLARQTLAELEALDADERDEDWETYHNMVLRDIRRLAEDLPLFVLAREEKDAQS